MDNITNDLIYAIEENPQGLITPKQYEIVTDAFVVVSLTLSFGGILTNGINARIFTSIGIKDGVSVSLLTLSMSDLCYCASSFIHAMSVLFSNIEVKYDVIFPINSIVVSMYSSNVARACYIVTVTTTTFLAVARCMCVVKPLHFKGVFTRSRAITISVFFVIYSLVDNTAIFSQMGTLTALDASVNTTRIVIWLSDARGDVKDAVALVNDTILSFATLLIVTVCVIVMADRLRKTAQFRNASSKSTGDDEESKETPNKLSGKELQVVQQVVLISLLYAVCSLPKMFISVYALVEPDFDSSKRLKYFFISMFFLRNVFETINSASNFFIYYNYNSAFRGFMTLTKKI